MRNWTTLLLLVAVAFAATPVQAGYYQLVYEYKPYEGYSVDGWPEGEWDGASGATTLKAWAWAESFWGSGLRGANTSAEAQWQKTWEWVGEDDPGDWRTTVTGNQEGAGYAAVDNGTSTAGGTARAYVEWGGNTHESAQASWPSSHSDSFEVVSRAFPNRVANFHDAWTIDHTEHAWVAVQALVNTDSPCEGMARAGEYNNGEQHITEAWEELETFTLSPVP